VKKEEAKFDELKNEFPNLDKFAEKKDIQKNLIALLSPEFFEKYKLPDDSYINELNDPNALIEKISNLSKFIYLGSPKKKFKDDLNTIYIPKIGNSKVYTSILDLKIKEQNYIKVIIDPTKSYAEFLASFLNSDLGLTIRSKCMKGYIPSLNKTAVGNMHVLIPSLKQQKNILNFLSTVNKKKNDIANVSNRLDELKAKLISKPSSLSNVSKEYVQISKDVAPSEKILKESFVKWIATIPFPLAVILRYYIHLKEGDQEKFRVLLKFFEATAAFFNTIYFGAYRESKKEFEEIKKKFKNADLNFKELTFGIWDHSFAIFGKYTRNLIIEDRKTCEKIFCDEDLLLPIILSDKKLVNIIQKAREIRNNQDAHGPLVDAEKAENLNIELYKLVELFREVMGDLWTKIELVQLNTSEAYSENEYLHHLSSLMGSDTLFQSKSIKMENCLFKENLYLINSKNTKPLKLEKFLQISSPPKKLKNACYFYNKVNSQGKVHFISYHYSNTVEGNFPEELLALIDEITEI
tara:strand:+ start:144 stop:1709 length:1566 start_codon:yes stop_codon:yes gene_type:complete